MSWNKNRRDLAGEPELALKALLRYLGRREYTAGELRKRLSERGAAAEDIEAALLYAQERGYQDDSRAGESHIRQRLDYAPRGRALVYRELRERGLASELAGSLLEEHYPREAERELLQSLLAKERPPAFSDGGEAHKYGQKMARRLLGKGFNQSLVIEALENWLPEPPQFMD